MESDEVGKLQRKVESLENELKILTRSCEVTNAMQIAGSMTKEMRENESVVVFLKRLISEHNAERRKAEALERLLALNGFFALCCYCKHKHQMESVPHTPCSFELDNRTIDQIMEVEE